MWICPRCAAESDAGFDVCWRCGTTREGVADPTFVPEVDAAEQPASALPKRTLITSLYPVGQACPQCGGTKYNKVKPDTWIAFAADRRCESCGCRYTPLTPMWACVVFLSIGLLGFMSSLTSLMIILASILSGAIPVDVPGILTNGIILVVSLLCLSYGLRSLWIQ
jgi:hypothetical protein